MIPGAPSDYDEWGHGWSHAAIEPYLARVERALRVRRFEAEELSPWHRAFAAAAGDDAIVHPVNAVGTVRWNAAFAYLDPVRERLEILADATVDRVLLSGDRAVGVATTGGEVRAEHVVLAAGAYGSPGILLRSGIGPDRGLPVGDGLADHVGIGLRFTPTPALERETAAFEATRPLFMGQVTGASRSAACPPDVGTCSCSRPSIRCPRGYELSAAAFAMKPHSRGSVRLTSRDPRAPLAVDHGFLGDERDIDTLVEGVEAVRALAADDRLGALRVARDPARGRAWTPGPTSLPRSAASSIPWGPARSAGWSTATAGCTGSTGSPSPMPRSCRRSRARTRTSPRWPWPSAWPSGS